MRRKAERPRTYTVSIERLSHEGRGVGRVDGKTVFVADALPGEEVTAKVTRWHKRYDEATVLEVLRANPSRITPPCRFASNCGGCSLQHVAPDAQLEHKERVLLELLQHQAAVSPVRVLPRISGPLWRYRRRARLSVRVVPKKGGALLGFREKASHFVTPIEHCPVLIPSIGERLAELQAVINTLSIAEHIPQIETVADDEHTLIVIRHLAALSPDDQSRLREFEQRSGLHVYLQAGALADARALTNPIALSYRVNDITYGFGHGDFVQVNAAINAELVTLALKLLEPTATDTVLDLYCGVGNFTLPLAQCAAHVVGVEYSPEVVARARDNARQNRLANIEFISADLTSDTVARDLSSRKFDLVLLDPPRSGADVLLRELNFRDTRRVLYISCNPVTLARDTAVLIRQHGFKLSAAGVVDMFPHTAHVESIAVFDRAS